MLKGAYHPKAFLSIKRNVRPGLMVRTRIVLLLEKGALNAKTIAQKTELSYRVVLYHLHLLEVENILVRKGNRPYLWGLTGAGQQRLTNTRS